MLEQAPAGSGVVEGTPPTLESAEAYPKWLDWLRYFCAFLLYMYGISKLLHLQFNVRSQLVGRPVGSLTGSSRGFTLASLGCMRRFSV
jgi:hypothetical protein